MHSSVKIVYSKYRLYMCSCYALCTVRKTCFLPFKSYLQLRETLLSNIYAVELHPWQSTTVAGRKIDECISPRSECSFCSSNFIDPTLDPILSLSNIRRDQTDKPLYGMELDSEGVHCVNLHWPNWMLNNSSTHQWHKILVSARSVSPPQCFTFFWQRSGV